MYVGLAMLLSAVVVLSCEVDTALTVVVISALALGLKVGLERRLEVAVGVGVGAPAVQISTTHPPHVPGGALTQVARAVAVHDPLALHNKAAGDGIKRLLKILKLLDADLKTDVELRDIGSDPFS